MNNQIINFTFEAQTVRTATNPQGEIYFCLPDVSAILAIKNGRDTIAKLDEKGVEKIYTPTKGGTQEITFINEPNLYRVIFRSNKAEAVKFQNWVFDEVLPSIRKTGSYTQKTTAADRTPLRQAVTALVAKYGLMHDEGYRLVHQYMGVEHIDEIALHDLPKAVAYVHGLMLNGLTKPQLSHATLERLAEQFSKTAILMNHIKNEYLPFLFTANYHRGEQFSSYLTLLKYDIKDNTRDLFLLLSDDIKTNKQHPITKNLEMAYYADNLLLCPPKAV
ncbi:MAG: BRO family protein [Moraxella sp.]|nr:BRO family protein [Moraxella sp.]